jgi:hypothetical protein
MAGCSSSWKCAALIDVDERHEGGAREVLRGALRGQDGIALLGGLENSGVARLDEADVMRELTAVLRSLKS